MTTEPPRALDHFVVAVHDAQQAGTRYQRLGFQMLPLMRHIELGSCNRIFQLEHTYFELLGDIDRATPAIRSTFGARFAGGEGLALVSLTSDDVRKDFARMQQLGLKPLPLMNARRSLTMPDGSEAQTNSEVCYVIRAGRTAASLFTSQHHKPETIFVPGYRNHANTCRRVESITYVSDDLALDAGFFAHVLSAQPIHAAPERVVFRTGRAEIIEFITAAGLPHRLGDLAPAYCPQLRAYPVAVTLAVAGLSTCRNVLRANGVRFQDTPVMLRVGAEDACGVVLEFVEG